MKISKKHQRGSSIHVSWCPFMNGQRGLYPQLGARQPGRWVPARYMFLCSPHGDQWLAKSI